MNTSVRGIHLEPTNICTLKCPGCARTRFIQQWPEKWKNHWLDPDEVNRFLDIDLSHVRINLCGNYGDPIYHPDLPCLVITLKNRGAHISIVTNGSYRTAEWWSELTHILGIGDEIIFSIDGLPLNFTEYRINADWASIRTGIETCVKSKIRCIWKFIPFAFNQLDLESAAKLSQDLGMTDFRVAASARFDELTMAYQPSKDLISRYKKSQDEVKKGTLLEIDPRCNQGDQHFISAQGFYSPCCFVADHRFYYKTQFGKNKKNYDITRFRLSELLVEQQTVRFYQEITTMPPQVCQYSCPKQGD